MAKSNNHLFLKYRSKSERNYYEFTDLFDLKPTDVLIMQYFMHMFKKSTAHGKHGKRGHCYYRNDEKFTGYHVSGHYKDIAKQIHAKISAKSVKTSVKRLQNKGLLFHHRSFTFVQFFFPIFDEDVRNSFNDPTYRTIINFSKIYEGQKGLELKYKKDFSSSLKRARAKVQKGLDSNVPKGNEPKGNIPKDNVVVGHHQKQQQTQTKSNSKNNSNNIKLPRWIIKHLNRPIGELVYKHCHNNMSKTKKYCTKINDIIFHINEKYRDIRGTEYWKGNANPYVQNQLLKDLKNVFDNDLDLVETIKPKYDHYIEDHTKLQLLDSDKNKQRKQDERMYNGFDIKTYIDNLDIIRKDIVKDKNNDDSKKLAKDQREFNKWVRLACKYTNLTPMYIKGTKAYKKSKRCKPSKAQIHKSDIIMAELQIKENKLDDIIEPETFVKIKNKILAKYKKEYHVTSLNECNYNGKAIRATVKQIEEETGAGIGNEPTKVVVHHKVFEHHNNKPRYVSDFESGAKYKRSDLEKNPKLDPRLSCSLDIIDMKTMNKLLNKYNDPESPDYKPVGAITE